MFVPETACIPAETSGILAVSSGFLLILYLVSGVANDTLSGVQSLVVKAGMRRYSPKVLDGVSKYVAINFPFVP